MLERPNSSLADGLNSTVLPSPAEKRDSLNYWLLERNRGQGVA